MILLLFLFGLALGAESPSDDNKVKLQLGNGCPMFWWNYNDRCYKYVATHMTWADAEIYCLSEGANLVSVHSEDEHNFVKSLIQNFDHAGGLTWIGLSDKHKEGTWMWSDGCPLHFVNWSPTQPDNEGGNENCGHTNVVIDKKWNDYKCDIALPSVCATHTTCS
uniref:C-type lectin domain-containing protein n=1 Tax=Amphilophus citrinellus TaxID=61819 RepID=A0A3Q0STL8_AMPCI